MDTIKMHDRVSWKSVGYPRRFGKVIGFRTRIYVKPDCPPSGKLYVIIHTDKGLRITLPSNIITVERD